MTLLPRSFHFATLRQLLGHLDESRPIGGVLEDLAHTYDGVTTADETETGYTIEVALPGFKRSEVSIETLDGTLFIETTKETKLSDSGRARCRKRSIALPDDVDATQISAKLEDGLLTVVCPKVAAAKPRKVEVL